MKKPGIFDPWRQAVPTAPAQEKLTTTEHETIVRFDGLRGGLSVTVNATPPNEAAKKEIARAALGLKQLGVSLSTYGIHTDANGHPRTYSLSDGKDQIVVVVEHDDNRTARHAIDALCRLFRDAQFNPTFASFLAKSKITPYLK